MTEEDIMRVEKILDGTYEQSSEEKAAHESMGIHNVNERIKLIYGEEYGLTIRPVTESETASTITIPLDYDVSKENTKAPNLKWSKLD
jgi:two-component system sensor histidine kinase YesM